MAIPGTSSDTLLKQSGGDGQLTVATKSGSDVRDAVAYDSMNTKMPLD